MDIPVSSTLWAAMVGLTCGRSSSLEGSPAVAACDAAQPASSCLLQADSSLLPALQHGKLSRVAPSMPYCQQQLNVAQYSSASVQCSWSLR